MAGIYNGHILEFPQIRVDCFTSPNPSRPWQLPVPNDPNSASAGPSKHPRNIQLIDAPNAQLYLLTHVHSDHLLGLGDNFTGKIICTSDTKRMLLRLEAELDRKHHDGGVREKQKRKYEGLRPRLVGKGTKEERLVDMIEALPYGFPKEYELGFDGGEPVKVTITLLDANHCPGSAMFLIKSNERAVLHTGDIRSDKQFMRSLRRNPAVQEFIAPTSRSQTGKSAGRRGLDRIYLDTGAVLGTGDMPDREDALQALLEQMCLYPGNTIFFLNVWCFGWEEVVKEVSRHFGEPVYVDRYKHSIYSAVQTDPFLLACTTRDPRSTRFHACERRARCQVCRAFDDRGRRINVDKRIVSVNMVEIKSAAFVLQQQNFLEALARAATGEGPWPYNIDCPFARHSPLPELQSLVKLFQPLALSPNTVMPQAQGLDYYLLPEFFKDCMPDSAQGGLIAERDHYFTIRFGAGHLKQLELIRRSSALDEVSLPLDEVKEESSTMAKRKSGRRADVSDQLARAGGLPNMPLQELVNMLEGDPRAIMEMGNDGLKTMGGPGLAAQTRMLEWGAGGVKDEWDTDEEDQERRKRGRKVKSESTVEAENNFRGAVDETAPKRVVRVMEDVKPEPLRAGRFSVDRDHLRALAMVDFEPT